MQIKVKDQIICYPHKRNPVLWLGQQTMLDGWPVYNICHPTDCHGWSRWSNWMVILFLPEHSCSHCSKMSDNCDTKGRDWKCVPLLNSQLKSKYNSFSYDILVRSEVLFCNKFRKSDPYLCCISWFWSASGIGRENRTSLVCSGSELCPEYQLKMKFYTRTLGKRERFSLTQ